MILNTFWEIWCRAGIEPGPPDHRAGLKPLRHYTINTTYVGFEYNKFLISEQKSFKYWTSISLLGKSGNVEKAVNILVESLHKDPAFWGSWEHLAKLITNKNQLQVYSFR